jgi:hypothetical protein
MPAILSQRVACSRRLVCGIEFDGSIRIDVSGEPRRFVRGEAFNEKSTRKRMASEQVPSGRLEAGEIGTAMVVHDCGRQFEVECVTVDDETLAAIVTQDDVRPVERGEPGRTP